MSTVTPRLNLPISLPIPSPSRSNPFARPNLPKSGSFTRTSLLPTLPSPVKPLPAGVDATPIGKSTSVAAAGAGSVSASAGKMGRSAWRMLWRGGVEIGEEGYRLEGITFFALLTFPSTPSQPISNPFDAPLTTPSHSSAAPSTSQSPFALPSADTDICLSLESMRGRKYLHIKGTTELADTDILEGNEDPPSGSGGVQMSIAPTSPLLIAYFTGILCRDPELGKHGRTKRAILLGLGDDDSPQNTLLVYGQHSPFGNLRLMVSRRRPPAPTPSLTSNSEIKVKPGEPLPRAPLFFPAKARKPLPFPDRSSLAKSRSFSRTSSVSSIYAPPVVPLGPPITSGQAQAQISAAVGGSSKGGTPGRRGEKRRREPGVEEDRQRKAGKVIMVVKQEPVEVNEVRAGAGAAGEYMADGGRANSSTGVNEGDEEDIFGKRSIKLEANPSSDGVGLAGEGSTGKKRQRVPQQVLDNKAMIRKQAMVLMEQRGYPRDQAIFKEVFAITTKGVYFVFRDALLDAPLDKARVQDYVGRHLDMYLPQSPSVTNPTDEPSEGSGEDTAVDDDGSLIPVKAPEAGSGEAGEEEDGDAGSEEIGASGLKGSESGRLPIRVREKPSGLSKILPIGLLDNVEAGSGSYSRRRSMDVVQEEDEDE